ncbi:MAG: family 43 glycosylhydrolase [Pseudobutyrivibrio sp.]|nr:family 43 glycosylhydrolase [Pseudobutyrivibrio sp.]
MKKQAFNPYLPSFEYVPDAEPYVFNDRLYIYGSHDRFAGDQFCMNDYVCWSAPVDDLGDWRYEGVIYKASSDIDYKKDDQHLFAPDVCQGPDDRYYLYYQLHTENTISVAVADKPEGPFEFYGQVKYPDGTVYGKKSGDAYGFDPGIFVDDDGRIYLYVGFSPDKGLMRTGMLMRGNNMDSGFVVELESDMLTITGQQSPTVPGIVITEPGSEFDGHSFFEASSVRKINGIYYFVYSSILSHELCYATSDTPTGPFSFGGTIVSIGDIGLAGIDASKARNFTGNTHGGLVEIKGQWYVFYHRQTNQSKCCRQACAEPIDIDSNGRIQQVEITSCGLNGGPLSGTGTYEARIACNLWGKKGTFPYVDSNHDDMEGYPYFTQSGVDREDNPDQYIADMQDGSVAGFKYFNFGHENWLTVIYRAYGNGKLRVRTELDGPILATIDIYPSDDWIKGHDDISLPVGIKPLYFTYEGNSRCDFKEFSLIEK